MIGAGMTRTGRGALSFEQVQVVAFQASWRGLDDFVQELASVAPRSVVRLHKEASAGARPETASLTLEVPDESTELDGVIALILQSQSRSKMSISRALRSI